MRLGLREVIVSCPRVMRPGLTDVPCEADLLVAVRGRRAEDAELEVLSMPCQHTLTLEEEGAVLDTACDVVGQRYAEQERD